MVMIHVTDIWVSKTHVPDPWISVHINGTSKSAVSSLHVTDSTSIDGESVDGGSRSSIWILSLNKNDIISVSSLYPAQSCISGYILCK